MQVLRPKPSLLEGVDLGLERCVVEVRRSRVLEAELVEGACDAKVDEGFLPHVEGEAAQRLCLSIDGDRLQERGRGGLFRCGGVDSDSSAGQRAGRR